jgi:hypothetical protein
MENSHSSPCQAQTKLGLSDGVQYHQPTNQVDMNAQPQSIFSSPSLRQHPTTISELLFQPHFFASFHVQNGMILKAVGNYVLKSDYQLQGEPFFAVLIS